MTASIMKYNPAFLTAEELVESFVVRQAELELILRVIQENPGGANQHVLAIGPRGIGKTMLVLRAAEAVRRREDLARQWYPLVFSEESYRVTTAGEFWHEAIFHLAQQTGDENWRTTYTELQKEKDDSRLRERAMAQLMDFADAEQKRLLLVVENLNMLLGEQMSDDEGWTLRHALLHEPRVMLLATATSRFEQIDNTGKPMFELFRTIELEPLDEDDCRKMWISISGMEPTDRRIRPIQILTGGNPRLVAIISSFGARMSFKQLMADLMQLVDDHTEYFKSHLDNLPPIERKVYLSLVELWDPSPARKVAENARLNVNKTSSLLKRLRERGAVVEANGKGRSKLYQVAERLYNIYYLMRRHGARSQRVRAVVNFMVAFYKETELLDVVHRLADEACQLSPEARADHYLAYEQILRCSSTNRLREKIMQLTPSDFFDAADVPNSLSEIIAAETELQLRDWTGRPEEHGPEVAKARFAFDKALALARRREYDSAICAFRELEQEHANADNMDMRLLVADALINIDILLRRQGRRVEALAVEGMLNRQLTRIEEDVAKAEVALDLLRQGNTLAKTGRYEEAIAKYDELVNRFADAQEGTLLQGIALAMLYKANALTKDKKHTRAVAYFDEFIRRFHNSSEPSIRRRIASAFLGKGHALRRQGKDIAAAEAYRRVMELDPENQRATLALAAVLANIGRLDESFEVLTSYLSQSKFSEENADAITELLIRLVVTGRAEDVLKRLQDSTSAEPLEPLVVGLRLYLGEDVKAAAEIMEWRRTSLSGSRKDATSLRPPMQSRKNARSGSDTVRVNTSSKAGGLECEPLKAGCLGAACGGVQSNICIWSKRRSSASCRRMYSRIAVSSRPTVEAKYPPGPEVLSCEIPPPPPYRPRNVNRTLAFDVPDHLGHSILGRDRDQHVHVIDDQVPFQNLALLLLGQPAKYLPEVLTQLLVELLAPTFRNEHDMVFAFPFRMP